MYLYFIPCHCIYFILNKLLLFSCSYLYFLLQYDPFSTPVLKAQIGELRQKLHSTEKALGKSCDSIGHMTQLAV